MTGKSKRKRQLWLGGVAEVADLLGISKSALADRRQSPGFPAPIAELACGPIWDMNEIDAYDRQRDPDHRGGRWINYPGRWHNGQRI